MDSYTKYTEKII